MYEQSYMVRPIVIAAGLVFLLFFIPGYLIAVLWEEDELFGGLRSATSFSAIIFLNHIPSQAGLEFFSVLISYYYGVVMLAIVIGAWTRSEVSNKALGLV